MEATTAPNERWSMDFVSARLLDGRWFRVLTVIDQYTRECVLLLADQSLTGEKVARGLKALLQHRPAPNPLPWAMAVNSLVERWRRGPTNAALC